MPYTTNALDLLLAIRNGEPDARWNYPLALGAQVRVTYSFTGLTEPMKEAARSILGDVEAMTRIDFEEVADGAGQMEFKTDFGSTLIWMAAGPMQSGSEMTGGDITLMGGSSWTAAALQPGGADYQNLMQAIATALGMRNPMFARDDGTELHPSLNTQLHTVLGAAEVPNMTLLHVTGSAGHWEETHEKLYASTFMPLDILALQNLYGVNTRGGDTVYRWERNQEFLETAWDGGGVDTVDCSNQVFRCEINLRPGQYSSIALRSTEAEIRQGLGVPAGYDGVIVSSLYTGENNFAIAPGAVIENASGGRAADSIVGNTAANRLRGNGGNDLLSGGAGRDTLEGGEGKDRLTGGTGNDVFVLRAVADSGATADGRDVITDFTSGQDRIDLSAIDARPASPANEAFTFIGAAEFTAAGQLRLVGGVLEGNLDRDAAAEFALQLTGVTSLSAADFLL